MSLTFTDSAIILRRISYGESDLVVTFFSEQHGRLSGFAKSAKNSHKRFGSSLEPGSISTLSCTQKPQSDWVFLQEAHTTLPSPALQRSVAKQSATWVALEWALLFLQEAQADQQKFTYLRNFLHYLHAHMPMLSALVGFQENWLSLSGYAAQDELFLQSLSMLKQNNVCKNFSWLDAAKEFSELAESITGKPCKSRACLVDLT
jgi:DNA repair protein RecO (recombination protein O)